MHALPGGEVQGKLSGVCSPQFASSRAQADQPSRQDLVDLAQTLVGAHAGGIERIVHERGFSWRSAMVDVAANSRAASCISRLMLALRQAHGILVAALGMLVHHQKQSVQQSKGRG